MTTKPDVKTMIERAHVAIMRSTHWCWLTNVLLLGKWDVIPDASVNVNIRGKDVKVTFSPVTTAATDGFNVYYYAPFIEKAWDAGGDKAIRTIVIHENLHKAYRHMTVWKALFDKDQKRANVAADIVINNEIAETGDFAMGLDALGAAMGMKFAFEPSCNGMNTGQVWDWLKDNPQAMGGGKDGEGLAGDMHMPGAGEGGDGELSEAEQEALMDAAVRQGIMIQRGRDPGRADRNAQATAPKVDWRAALRNWLSGRSFGYDRNDWKKRSRRSRTLNIYLPSHYSERTGGLAICVDTSGSIGGSQLGQFLGEIGSLCKSLQPRFVELVYWDGAVAGVEYYKPGQYETMIQSTKPKGGGGTTLGAAVQHVKGIKDLRGAIVLTDGYVEGWHQGSWPCDTFVVLNSNAACPLPHVRI